MMILVLVCLVCVSESIFYDLSRGQESLAQSILDAIDFSVSPCDNIYNFSCGTWVRTRNESETYESRMTDLAALIKQRTIDIVMNNEDPFLANVIEGCQTQHLNQSIKWVADTYFADIDAIDPTDLTQLLQYLGKLFSNRFTFVPNSFVQMIGNMATGLATPSIFDISITGSGNSTESDGTVEMIFGAHLNLFDESLYDPSQNSSQDVIDYKSDLSNFFTNLGTPDMADKIWNLEVSYLKAFKSSISASNFALPLEKMNEIIGADFSLFFKSAGIEIPKYVMAVTPDNYWPGDPYPTFPLFQGMKAFLSSSDAETLRAYFKFNSVYPIIRGQKAIDSGETTMHDVCMQVNYIGFYTRVTFYYMKKYFSNPMATKKRLFNVLDQIKKIYDNMFDSDHWMSDPVIQYAKLKLSKMGEHIMYPQKQIPYESIVTDFTAPIWKTLEAVGNYIPKNGLFPLIGQKLEFDPYWFMDWLMVNAFNYEVTNDIIIPEGILQNPFYDDIFPDSIVYARVGHVLGHEISHSFDNNGRTFDAEGDKRDWWDEPSEAEFDRRTKCFIDQYDKFVPPQDPTEHVDGKTTLPENLADNVGMKVAFEAYRAVLGDRGSLPSDLIPRFTNDQLFFIAEAQLWCTKADKVNLGDVHSPSEFRPIGIGQNMKEFAEAFKCPVGSYMNPETKCEMY